MKYISMLILSLFALNAHAQQIELELLLSVQNVSMSEISDICLPEVVCRGYSNEGLAYKLGAEKLSEDTASNSRAVKKVQKFNANTVEISILGGFTFHVADYYGYYGNTRVVTCLDGDMQGHQAIADNGILQAESNDVTWHKGYFIHRYPYGRVTSFPKSQAIELEVK